MNIVSVQIYSASHTPWDRSKIDFPIDLNTMWPGNGCGLCNQFFKLINTMCYVDNSQNDIYIDLFSKDIEVGDTTPISNILDLDLMRNKHGLKIYDIVDLDYNLGYSIVTDPYVFRSYHNNRDLFTKNVKSLEFNEVLVNLAKKVIVNKGLNDRKVNLVHLRIDKDMENNIVRNYGGESKYIELLDSYRDYIYSKCDNSLPLVLLLEDIDHSFVKSLMEDYEVVFFEKKDILEVDSEISGREIFALVDLIIGLNLDVNTFIGYEPSSFSVILDTMNKYDNSYLFNCSFRH